MVHVPFASVDCRIGDSSDNSPQRFVREICPGLPSHSRVDLAPHFGPDAVTARAAALRTVGRPGVAVLVGVGDIQRCSVEVRNVVLSAS